jgi:hypothetical protein
LAQPNNQERNHMPDTTQTPEWELAITKGENSPFRITEHGIIIKPDLEFDDWRDGLKLFKWAQLNLKLSLADYLKYGEVKYGEIKAREAVEQLELPLSNITSAVAINTIPKQIRDLNLSAEHLVVLAKAGKTLKSTTEWAQKAAALSLTPAQLKESIKQGEVVDPEIAKKNQRGIITIHGIRMEAEIWLRRMGGLEGLKGLGVAEKEEIRNEISLFLQIQESLEQ